MIKTSGLCKSYHLDQQAIPVLNSISLEIEAGEYIAIMGPSGAGKSTLLNVLGCLDKADGGQYLLAGEDVSLMRETELDNVRKKKIGFVFQSAQFVDYLDLLDNVSMPGFYEGQSREYCRDRARSLLQKVGLDRRVSHRPGQLSGGECQRAAVARSLFNHPQLLLADEPTGNLDSANSAQLTTLFSELHEQGLTIILITHNPEVANSAQRRLHLRDGQLSETSAAA